MSSAAGSSHQPTVALAVPVVFEVEVQEIHLANNSARCSPFLALEILLSGIRWLVVTLVSSIIWWLHLHFFHLCIYCNFYSSKFHMVFQRAISVSCPFPYFFLYLAFPFHVPLNPSLLVSPLSVLNTVFYLSFLGMYPPLHWSLT